jgi:hypothetical protein
MRAAITLALTAQDMRMSFVAADFAGMAQW